MRISKVKTKEPFHKNQVREWLLNIYYGCDLVCSYCYWQVDEEWTNRITVYTDVVERLTAEIGNILKHIRISLGWKDGPYTSIEREHELTRGYLKLLFGCEMDITVPASRGNDITLRDLDLLTASGVHVVVITEVTRLDIAKEFNETRTHMASEVAGTLKQNGVNTCTTVSPVMPDITDVERVAAASPGIPAYIIKLDICPGTVWGEKTLVHVKENYPHLYRQYKEIARTGEDPYSESLREKHEGGSDQIHTYSLFWDEIPEIGQTGGAGNIICIDAVNLDRTYRVENVVKGEETMNCRGYEEFWGGKGLNQVAVLRCAGEHSIFIAKVGQREEFFLRESLASKGVSDSYIAPVNGYTNHGVIQMTPQGRTVIIGAPSNEVSFTPGEIGVLMEGASWEDTLLLQDETAHVPEIIRLAKEKGCTVALNPSSLCNEMREWPLGEADTLILNGAKGQASLSEMLVGEILAASHRRYPKSQIVLALGEWGSVSSNDVERIEQPSVPTEAVDTPVAGDTFTGYFLVVYEKTGDVAVTLETVAMAVFMMVGHRDVVETIPVTEEVTG